LKLKRETTVFSIVRAKKTSFIGIKAAVLNVLIFMIKQKFLVGISVSFHAKKTNTSTGMAAVKILVLNLSQKTPSKRRITVFSIARTPQILCIGIKAAQIHVQAIL